MTCFTDYAGRVVRLTDERRAHLLTHPEMVELVPRPADAIADPDIVVQSNTDDTVFLYYREMATDAFGDKFRCVVIKHLPDDAFVITAYLTDRLKAGATTWTRP